MNICSTVPRTFVQDCSLIKLQVDVTGFCMQVRKAIGTYTSSFALPITDIDKLKIVKNIVK